MNLIIVMLKDFEERLSNLRKGFLEKIEKSEKDLTRIIIADKDSDLMTAINKYDSMIEKIERYFIRRGR